MIPLEFVLTSTCIQKKYYVISRFKLYVNINCIRVITKLIVYELLMMPPYIKAMKYIYKLEGYFYIVYCKHLYQLLNMYHTSLIQTVHM